MESSQDNNQYMSDFDEYLRQGEPDRKQKAEYWRTAIGLQDVDGLKTSDYLKQTARRNIEGEITIEEVQHLVKTYYQRKTAREEDDDKKEEADRVSANIAQLLGEDSFVYSVVGITSIHRRIFEGVFKHAGEIRNFDISKKEWVLRGDSVLYGNAPDLRRALVYDLEQEREFSYIGIPIDETIKHIAKFISGLWQIHPFAEGNTRTTAVFTIKYLRSLGFQVNNDLFSQKSWYFRNALVRANYHNYIKGVDYEPIFLIRFFRNLLLDERNELRNRFMLIDPPKEWKANTRQVPDKYPTSTRQVSQLVMVIGNHEYSTKEILDVLHLKNRENFMDSYLTPAINEGLVTMLYPDSPRHPRQKYHLTIKGLHLYNSLNSKEMNIIRK
jgi:fido (protein-threonine AMPylation protein)